MDALELHDQVIPEEAGVHRAVAYTHSGFPLSRELRAMFERSQRAWRVAERFEIASTVTILLEAAHGTVRAEDWSGREPAQRLAFLRYLRLLLA